MDDGVLAPAQMVLKPHQINTLNSLERTGATLSLVGVSLVIISYALFKRLRTVPNTFIFFASIANIGASIACAIGYDGVLDLQTDPKSALCQTQAFLFEWFMQSDPWWSLAMAVNVFMVFFWSFSPTFFRKYVWLYCLICYGMPAIPAFVCLFIKTDTKGKMYGDATLWCWIDANWNSLRIYTYYLPIWVCIILSALIYLAVGYQVFHQRNQLRNLTLSAQGKEVISWEHAERPRESAEKTLTGQPAYYGTVTHEVKITRDAVGSAGQSTDEPPSPTSPTIGPATAGPVMDWSTPTDAGSCAAPSAASIAPSAGGEPYYKVTSRVTANPRRRRTVWSSLAKAGHRFVLKFRNMDPVKLAYLRTSFVFAISVLVTWTPSSINRVYTLVHPHRFSYGLNIAASIVLPLQGVWNAVIYFTTSWALVKEEWFDLAEKSATLRKLPWGLGGRSRPRGAGTNTLGVEGMGRSRRIVDDPNAVEMSPRSGTMRVVRGVGLDSESV
ncbi:G-protein coupled receptor [Pleurostoma richardsiae]|uniref:G-protein coupled receptor n=1 Tax=Pleurostoma richardsiae TaxID=41990 RepID=A0AA38RW87_9PEZI|nr:G-protein coupled receptor [Pleurostoma richardsiae]